MFTLVLCFPRQGRMPSSKLSISADYVPQVGTTLNTPGPRVGTWAIDHIGQDTDGEKLSNTLFVYLKEVDD
jgi:hypothetical protein